MGTAEDHYRRHLARVYVWMAGGLDAAIAAGDAEVAALGLPVRPGDLTVDLGAGFGMHSIPIARRGGRVLAVDSSAELLGSLAEAGRGLPIRAVEDDLRSFRSHLPEPAAAILCMGDTITHLGDGADVAALLRDAAAALAPGGMIAVTLRDYTAPLTGASRFIPVRSDRDRLLTCVLEYEEGFVGVNDLLHERDGDGWRMTVSAYRKLRLAPESLVSALRATGLTAHREDGLRGMVRILARADP